MNRPVPLSAVAPDPPRAEGGDTDGGTVKHGIADAWLALQCHLIPRVQRGVLVLVADAHDDARPSACWPPGQSVVSGVVAVARRAIETSAAVVHSDAGSSRPRLVIGAPLLVDGEVIGAAALLVERAGEKQQRAVLQLLQWGAAWLDYMLRHDATAVADRLATAMRVVATALEPERFEVAASAVADALAVGLDCERASVGLVAGAGVSLLCTSHSDQIDSRSGPVRAIERAMTEALEQDAMLCWPPAEEHAPHVLLAHAELARAGSVATLSMPLARQGEVFAVVTLERNGAEHPFDARTLDLCQALRQLLGPVLDLKRRDQQPLRARFRRAVGSSLTARFGPRRLALKAAALVALAGIAASFLVHDEFQLTADAVLESAQRRVVAAPLPGFIRSASVRAGDTVAAGQPLAALDSRDLELERLKWQSKREQLDRGYREVLAKRDRAALSVLRAQVAQAVTELDLVEQQLARMRFIAPFDGVVVSGDLQQRIGAPVQQGEVLFEIAPLTLSRVRLEVDERDIAQLAVGQHGRLALTARIDADPLEFDVERITPVSRASDGRNIFEVEARLVGHAVDADGLRPGMRGIAKISIDERPVASIVARRLLDWLRLAVWRWWP